MAKKLRDEEIGNMKLTNEDLSIIRDFAEDTPGHDINPKWLISMVDEIRERRNAVGTRLIEMGDETRQDLGIIVGLAMNAHDAEEFVGCLETIAEMIFPELIGGN